LALLILMIAVTALPALGRREGTVVEVTGTVRLVGNAPFYELVITGEEHEWYVAKEDQQKLWDLQQRVVTVEGSETVTRLTFVNGFSAGERRTLKDIKIISVET